MTTTTNRQCSPEPIWAGGQVDGTGRFNAFTDYRWECGCGHRYDHSGRVEIGAQHTAHLAEAEPATVVPTVYSKPGCRSAPRPAGRSTRPASPTSWST